MTSDKDRGRGEPADGTVGEPLPLPFYLRDTLLVARQLLGKHLVRRERSRRLVLRIVETEAYLPDDPASHSYRGPGGRAAVMFEEGGVAYVYLIYGMHHCLNVVTGERGYGAAVLIRSGEPLEGIATMWRRRFPSRPFRAEHTGTLANGPAKLTRAMGISPADNGRSLLEGELTIRDGPEIGEELVRRGPRVGIRHAADRPWRFFVRGNPCVSRG